MNCFNLLFLFGSAITIIKAQSSSYGRSFYSSVITPTSHYSYHHGGSESRGFVPLTYNSDLIPEESKNRSPPKYLKKPTYKGFGSDEDDISSESYTSDEYSHEPKHHPFASKENDSREYTIGTHIRVQHPITSPKKTTIPYPTKSSKYTNLSNTGGYSLDLSQEERGSDTYLPSKSTKKHKYTKGYEPDPFHVIPPPKSKSASHYHHSPSSTGSSYNVYEPEPESYENPDIAIKHLKANLRDRYRDVASKKQIEKYIEDQGKLLDEALKLQLLNSPKFQKILKTAEKEHQFNQPEFEDEYIANVPPPYRDSFHKTSPTKLTRSRRRPSKSKPLVSSKPNRKYRSAFVIEV